MSRYKILEYCSVIDALRWLAFGVEPVSQEDEAVLISRNKRKPLELSSLVVVAPCVLGKIRYGSGTEELLKRSLTEDEKKLKASIPNLTSLLKNYNIDISGSLFSKSQERSRKLRFRLKNKGIFVETKNPQQYELGYFKEVKSTISGKDVITCVAKTFYMTKINFSQLKAAARKRLEEENANIDLTDCQTRKKAIKERAETLDPMPMPEAVRTIQKHFNKCDEDEGWHYKTLAGKLEKFKNADGSRKFSKAPQGNFRKNK